MKTLFDRINFAVKSWWLSLIIGVLFVGLGFLLMFTPVATYITLSFLFSVTMFVSGVFEILFAISNRRNLSSWGWYIATGLIDLALGMYLIYVPGMSMVVLPFVVAFWLMFKGFSSMGYAFDLKRYGVSDWGWYLIFGFLAIICSIGVMWQPIVGALSVVYIVSFAIIFLGLARIMLAFGLRKLHKINQKFHAQNGMKFDDSEKKEEIKESDTF